MDNQNKKIFKLMVKIEKIKLKYEMHLLEKHMNLLEKRKNNVISQYNKLARLMNSRHCQGEIFYEVINPFTH